MPPCFAAPRARAVSPAVTSENSVDEKSGSQLLEMARRRSADAQWRVRVGTGAYGKVHIVVPRPSRCVILLRHSAMMSSPVLHAACAARATGQGIQSGSDSAGA